MYFINLKEHAAVDEVLEYVKQTNPKHVIIDNSSRVGNPDNSKWLAEKIKNLGFDVTLSPKNHPRSN